MAFEQAAVNFIDEEERARRRKGLYSVTYGSMGKAKTKLEPQQTQSSTRSSARSSAPTPLSEESAGFVSLDAKGIWLFKSLAPNVCEVTYVVTFQDNGNLPTSFTNAKIGQALNAATFLKDFYNRNGLTVDKEISDAFVKKIPTTINLITEEQMSIVERQMKSINYLDDKIWEPLPEGE